MDAKCPLATSTTLIFEHKGTLTLSREKRDPRAKVRRNGRLWIHKETLVLYQIQCPDYLLRSHKWERDRSSCSQWKKSIHRRIWIFPCKTTRHLQMHMINFLFKWRFLFLFLFFWWIWIWFFLLFLYLFLFSKWMC
jgi:hypothetical protein